MTKNLEPYSRSLTPHNLGLIKALTTGEGTPGQQNLRNSLTQENARVEVHRGQSL